MPCASNSSSSPARRRRWSTATASPARVPGAGRQPRAPDPAGPARQIPQGDVGHHLRIHRHPRARPDLLRPRHRLSVSRRRAIRKRPTRSWLRTIPSIPRCAARSSGTITAVNEEPVKEAVRSYMSAYAPFFDRSGRFVGVIGVDMWVRDFDARIDAIRRAGIGAFAAVALLSLLTGFVVLRLSRTAQRARRARSRRAIASRRGEEACRSACAARASGCKRQERFSRDDEPRNSHAHERSARVRQSAARYAAERRAARVRADGAALQRRAAHRHQRRARLLEDRSRAHDHGADRLDLHSVCDGVRAILQSAALERGVSMRIDYDDRLPKYIKGDPVRIRQVLLNLAGNAVKFTECGSVRIE